MISDRPVHHLANYWRVVSPYDLLHVISKQVSEHHLIKFEDVFVTLMSQTDPALDLEPKMRFAAVMFNKSSTVSDRIKDGLCNTLVLLAVYGESAGIEVNFDIQQWVDGIVRKLLTNRDANFWMSIEGKLHLLAEASPNSFLDSLESLIKEQPTIISEMFGDGNFELFTPSYYIHLLWALESLAWEPSLLPRVSMILAELTQLDKGIKTANKPINSLRAIFLTWLPQTFASLATREGTIDLLVERHSDTAFALLKSISPQTHDTGHFSYKPIYRLRESTYQRVTIGERDKAISFVASRLIKLCEADSNRWTEIIDLIDDFYGKDRSALVSSMQEMDVQHTDKAKLREAVRQFIQRHEHHSEQTWALKPEELLPIKKFYEGLIDSDIDRYFWYFNIDTIHKYRESGLSYEELLKKADEARKQAIQSIFSNGGLDDVIELAKRVDKPWQVGYLLVEIQEDLEGELIQYFGRDAKLEQFSSGYFYGKSKKTDIKWIEQWARQLLPLENSEQNIANFFLAQSPSLKVWDLLEDISKGAYAVYWEKGSFHYGQFRDNPEDMIKCIQNLNNHSRFANSVNMISLDKDRFSAEIVYETLEGLATTSGEAAKLHYGSHGIQELFAVVDRGNISVEKMIQLEWHYLEILIDSPHTRPPKYLYQAIRQEPSFFAQLVSWIYKFENSEDEPELGEAERKGMFHRARRTDHLLDTLDLIPGEDANHNIDQQTLHNWIIKASEACSALGRTNMGLYTIGKIIGISHERSATWPSDEICQIVEKFDNSHFRDGLNTGIFNGSQVRASLRPAGGHEERKRYEYFRKLSDSISNKSPVLSRVLLDVALHFQAWAKNMDLNDEQRELD